MTTNLVRRKFLKTGGVILYLLPLIALSRQAEAKSNDILRLQFKYQNSPKENMSCSNCLEFLPNKNEKDLGGCKVIPGDDEISPNGYCTRWNTM